jgi:hypothetical protein
VASGGFKDKYPKGKIDLNIDIADLEKLNLHAGPLKIRVILQLIFSLLMWIILTVHLVF